jgi:K+ transporter
MDKKETQKKLRLHDEAPSFVWHRLLKAKLSIVTAIAIYIGLIVSDPATSPFYAIESALHAVGHQYIVQTMLIVLAVAVSVAIGYAAIGMRFNRGEGGTGLVFEWLGSRPAMIAAAALLLDFVLTDAVTTAAATAALVSLGINLNRYIIAAAVFLIVGVLLRLGDKGRIIFATLSYGFMALVLYTVAQPLLPNAPQILAAIPADAHAVALPEPSGATGFALFSLLILGAVRGFALLTGFEASVAALAQEEEKPKYARIAMGVGTILLVLVFTSIATIDISKLTKTI